MTPEPQATETQARRRYRRLLNYLKPAKWHFAGGILAGLVFAAVSGFGFPMMVYIVAPVIFGETKAPVEQVVSADATNAIVSASPTSATNTTSTATGAIDSRSLAKKDKAVLAQEQLAKWAKWLFGDDYQRKLLLVACLGLPVIFLVRGISLFLNRYLINHAGFLVLEALRADVFRRLQQLPLAFYHRHKSGDLTARLMTDTENLKNLVVLMSLDLLKAPFTLIGSLAALLFLALTNKSALFVLVTLASIPICVIPIRIIGRRLIKKARQLASQTGELNSVVIEGLQSPMEIQAYNLQPRLLERFMMNVRSIFRLSMKTVKYQAFINPLIEFVSVCGFMVALYFGAKNGMNFSTFSAMGLALYSAYEPAKKLSNIGAVWKIHTAAIERLEQVLEAEDTVPQPTQPIAVPSGRAEIVFERVSFKYPPRESNATAGWALENVSASFQLGEIIALIGPSGAGKSTFAALIPRFYDPTAGRLMFGGVDLRQLDKSALRDRIALVPQMPALFNTTIAENIRMGRLTATDAEVRAAAQKAFVTDFIDSLPQGYDTVVGERGATLSGGQRQRIAIARAFLKNAPILILDEATSALDSEREAKIQQALKELVKGRTTFMIAHRFSSISLATRILVFESGRITGDGSPDELKKTHNVFQRMTELQQLK